MKRITSYVLIVALLYSSFLVTSCDYETYSFEKFTRESLANSVWSPSSPNANCSIDSESVSKANVRISEGVDGNNIILTLIILDETKVFCFPTAGNWSVISQSIPLTGEIYDVTFDQNVKLSLEKDSDIPVNYDIDARVSGHLRNLTFTKFSPSPIIVGTINYEWTQNGVPHKIVVSLNDPR